MSSLGTEGRELGEFVLDAIDSAGDSCWVETGVFGFQAGLGLVVEDTVGNESCVRGGRLVINEASAPRGGLCRSDGLHTWQEMVLTCHH